MARNDVFLNINALSPADAVVTGQQDMTAATVPELVLGDTPTFNFYFTDNTNVWPSWAGNAAYTVTWALSDAVSGDFSPAATTGNATPITGGWSVVLPLNAYDLVGLLNTKRVSQPYPVTNLWQQIRVADPSGNEVTRAMFWTPVRYRAISDTQNTESASPTGGREVTVDNVNVLTTPTAAQFYAANPVPTSALGSAANGELLIGNGTGFTKSTLTAGTGITVTNGSGSITIDASGAQETLTATVKNAESVAITKGQVVYLFGATGNIASVKLAYNTSDATSAKTFGVVSDTSIAPNGTGTVTCVGVVDGLNLGAYQDGDTLYLGATPGSVTATKPYAPNHLVYVGIIERANAGNGELYVRVQNGYELDEIHDVQINSPRQSGQTLIYDNTTSLWKNARITAGSNIAVTNGDGSISIGFSGTLPVANGGTGVTTSTGSGSVVLSTSPTLTTPILGTPQSGTLSSCTGLPISTGVSGLGTNVATFLATPSSANLASAVTDETGTGALVFANTPTLVTPNIGAATGTSFNLTGSGTLGTTLTVNSTTDSSSKDTGAIVTEGGLGVEKSATFGGNLTVSGTGTSSFAGKLTIGAVPTLIGVMSVRPVANGILNIRNAGEISANSGAAIDMLNDASDALTDFTVRAANYNFLNTGPVKVGGNLTVSGGQATISSSTTSLLNLTSTGASGKVWLAQSYSDGSFYITHQGVKDAIRCYPTTGNTEIGGNLTVSGGTAVLGIAKAGTGIAGFAEFSNSGFFGTTGYAICQNSSGATLINAATGQDVTIRTNQNSLLATFNAAGNLLLNSTGTDSANGKLQLATHTTSAGGIGFGSDTSIYSNNSGQISIDHVNGTSPLLVLRGSGSNKAAFYSNSGNAYIDVNTAGGSLYFRPNGGTLALTLDSTQAASFAQGIKVSGLGPAFSTASSAIYNQVASATPQIQWINSGGGTDAKVYDWLVTTTQLAGRLVNDTNGAANNWITVSRSGYTVSSVAFGGPIKLNNAYVAGAPTATGYVTIQDSAGNTYKVLVGT